HRPYSPPKQRQKQYQSSLLEPRMPLSIEEIITLAAPAPAPPAAGPSARAAAPLASEVARVRERPHCRDHRARVAGRFFVRLSPAGDTRLRGGYEAPAAWCSGMPSRLAGPSVIRQSTYGVRWLHQKSPIGPQLLIHQVSARCSGRSRITTDYR